MPDRGLPIILPKNVRPLSPDHIQLLRIIAAQLVEDYFVNEGQHIPYLPKMND